MTVIDQSRQRTLKLNCSHWCFMLLFISTGEMPLVQSNHSVKTYCCIKLHIIVFTGALILARCAALWQPLPDIFNISERSSGDLKSSMWLSISQAIYLLLFIASKSLTFPNTCALAYEVSIWERTSGLQLASLLPGGQSFDLLQWMVTVAVWSPGVHRAAFKESMHQMKDLS